VSKPRLLFISTHFPDTRDPHRGLDNAALLHQLRDRWEIATLAIRPVLPFGGKDWEPRGDDGGLFPRYVASNYLPKVGQKLNHRLMAMSLRKELRGMNGAFQVALTTWLHPDCCAVALLANEMKFPFVAVATGGDVHECRESSDREKLITKLIPSASAVVTRSKEAAAMLVGMGVSGDRIHPIYNGVDLELFHPGDSIAAREELGLPGDRRIILFVGEFVATKNPLVLIEAFARLRDDDAFENTVLVIVGGGPLVDEMTFRAGRSRTADHVLFAGRQPPANIARFMRAADVLCLPNEREGVPNVVFEAFATGLPVVASSGGGIGEIHHEGSLGRLSPPRDVDSLVNALKQTLSQPPPREKIRQYALQFSWARTADSYHQILEKAARGVQGTIEN
jgi:glycosyltransferase involved in cell wall biosynthesis